MYQIPLDNELIVDNFAGGGGASTGIEMALGRPVNIAINHDREAISMHEANHPNTLHLCEDVWDVDPREVCKGRPVALAWFSPDCKHFSKAKGGKPVEKKIRGLAWVAIRWAATVSPRVIMLENVEEFVTWGPLKNGLPDPVKKGMHFKSFVKALKRLGYQVEWKELRACDYGAPTIRKRLFLIARRDGQPIIWPSPTHGVAGSGLLPYHTAAECIDWSLECPSIFERSRELAPNTMKRIARGIKKYVMDCAEPFIVPVCHGDAPGQQPRTHDINEPLPTITGKGKHAIVTPFFSRMFGQSIGQDLRQPSPTATAKEKTALLVPYLTECANASSQRIFAADEPLRTQCAQVKGGHFALCSAFIVKHFGGVTGVDIRTPLPTTMTRGTQNQLVTSHVMKMRGDNVGHSMEEPLHTISAGGTHHADVRAFLLKYYGNEKDGADLQDPIGTVTTKDRFGLVTIHGEPYQIVDIGMRMLSPRELYRAQGFPEDYIIDRKADGTFLNKTSQVRMCGNSVCPPLAAALVRANVQRSVLLPEIQQRKRA